MWQVVICLTVEKYFIIVPSEVGKIGGKEQGKLGGRFMRTNNNRMWILSIKYLIFIFFDF